MNACLGFVSWLGGNGVLNNKAVQGEAGGRGAAEGQPGEEGSGAILRPPPGCLREEVVGEVTGGSSKLNAGVGVG